MFGINSKFNKPTQVGFSVVLFIICFFFYGRYSHERHQENPQDKLMPTPSQMWRSFSRAVFRPIIEEEYNEDGELIPNDEPKTLLEAYQQDRLWEMLKNGEWQLFEDTLSSSYRIFVSMIFILFGVLIGLYMGVFPFLEHLLYQFFLFFDKLPALAVLPILFIAFGLGETAKIALMVIGVAPTIILDTYLRVKDVPKEQFIKGQTLNAGSQEIVFRIILPQILPKVLDTIRLNFKAVILFLIAGEALAAESGLGYRIFVVRRYMDMATIIPYVIWISLLAFLVDYFLRMHIKKRYAWSKQ